MLGFWVILIRDSDKSNAFKNYIMFIEKVFFCFFCNFRPKNRNCKALLINGKNIIAFLCKLPYILYAVVIVFVMKLCKIQIARHHSYWQILKVHQLLYPFAFITPKMLQQHCCFSYFFCFSKWCVQFKNEWLKITLVLRFS